MEYIKEEIYKRRNEIDGIDENIVRLLTRRMHLALEIADLKANNVAAVTAKNRVSEVLDRIARLTIENNGDEEFILEIYTLIIDKLTQMQLKKKGMM